MIDKYGKCPNCNKDWKGRDINEELVRLSAFNVLSKDSILQLAGRYGYTPETPGVFSLVTIHETEQGTFYQCPSIRCGHIFNAETGEEYLSLYDFLRGTKASEYKEVE